MLVERLHTRVWLCHWVAGLKKVWLVVRHAPSCLARCVDDGSHMFEERYLKVVTRGIAGSAAQDCNNIQALKCKSS